MQSSIQNRACAPRLASRLLTLALASVLCFAPARASHEATEPSDGTVNSFRWLKNPVPLPDFSIQRWPEERVGLSSFRGQIVLLNLWATWCPPCVYELPALDRLQQRLGGDEFAVVAVSVDRDPAQARKLFVDRLALGNLTFFAEAPEKIAQTFPMDVLPSNFIIDREGRVIGMLRSYVDWDSPVADKFVERLLDGSLTALPGN